MSEGETERYEVDDVLTILATTEGLVAEHGPLAPIWLVSRAGLEPRRGRCDEGVRDSRRGAMPDLSGYSA